LDKGNGENMIQRCLAALEGSGHGRAAQPFWNSHAYGDLDVNRGVGRIVYIGQVSKKEPEVFFEWREARVGCNVSVVSDSHLF